MRKSFRSRTHTGNSTMLLSDQPATVGDRQRAPHPVLYTVNHCKQAKLAGRLQLMDLAEAAQQAPISGPANQWAVRPRAPTAGGPASHPYTYPMPFASALIPAGMPASKLPLLSSCHYPPYIMAAENKGITEGLPIQCHCKISNRTITKASGVWLHLLVHHLPPSLQSHR